MSQYNSYVKRVNDIATKVFSEYAEREQALRDAKETLDRASKGSALEKANAIAKYEKEKAEYDSFFRNAPDKAKDNIASIRNELSKALSSKYAFDVEKVDAVTLELLKSGLLTSEEYADILTKAESQENYTLARLVGRYAVEQAKATSDKVEQNALYGIHAKSKVDSAKGFLDDFDTLTDVFNRTMNNTGMIRHWERLTGSIIENF